MSSLGFWALAALPLLSQLAHAQSCSPVDSIKLTFYGYPDGPGDTTSFGCSGSTPFQSTPQNPGTAGGSGSYDDPFSMATLAGSTNFQECELVYIPYLKKYFRYQDHCSGCDSNHIDLWIGTDSNGGATQISCEDTLGTSTQTVIKNPPNGLDVDAQNLWDGSCHPDQVFTNADTSSLCSGGSGGTTGGSSSSAAAGPAPVTTPPPSQPTTPAPQQPTSTSTSAAVPGTPGGQPPSQGQPQIGNQKQVVRPTTLQTVASTPVSTNEPTGTPLATANGVCTTAGAAVCSVDGKQIGICNTDMTVVFMDVAPGTKCVNGGMVFANS